jgi:hypothetical protein
MAPRRAAGIQLLDWTKIGPKYDHPLDMQESNTEPRPAPPSYTADRQQRKRRLSTVGQYISKYHPKLSFWNTWSDHWTWELLVIVLCGCAFASLIVFLAVYNGKTTPQLPLGITFNAIISTLATVIKSAVFVCPSGCGNPVQMAMVT